MYDIGVRVVCTLDCAGLYVQIKGGERRKVCDMDTKMKKDIDH